MAIEIRPKLEIGREYKFGEYNGSYLGCVDRNLKKMHVFLIKTKEKNLERLYGLYDDQWICEVDGNISHNLLAPVSPEYIGERDLNERGLSQILKMLEENIKWESE